jgi:hypothetical protein
MAKLPKIQITRAFKACFNGEMHPRDVEPGIYEVVADGAAVGDGQVPQRVADIAEETGRCKPTKKSNGPADGVEKQSASPQTDPALTDQTSNTPDLLAAGSSPSTTPGTSPAEPQKPATRRIKRRRHPLRLRWKMVGPPQRRQSLRRRKMDPRQASQPDPWPSPCPKCR